MTAPGGARPLSEPVYRILLALRGAPLHGYAILQAVEEEGFALGTATLYTALARLRDDGIVEEVDAPEAGTDARRRTYRLTERGRARIRHEARRLEALIDLARRAPEGA